MMIKKSFGVVLIGMILLSMLKGVSAQEEALELEEVTVTATKTERRLSEVAASVTVITREDIEKSSAKYIDDLLKEYAGIIVTKPQGSTSARTWVRLRGLPHPRATLVMKDGVPVNRYVCGGTKFAELPLERVERIEIVRGANSSLYGSSAMGGVINIITKKPEKKTEANISASRGSNSTSIGDIDFSSFLTEKLNFTLHTHIFESDGYDSWNYDAIREAKIEAMLKKGKTQAQAENIVNKIMENFRKYAENNKRDAYNVLFSINYMISENSRLSAEYSKWNDDICMGRKYFNKEFDRDRFILGYLNKGEKLKISANAYYLDEQFNTTFDKKPKPSAKYWGYDAIDVLNKIPVQDMGGNLTLSCSLGGNHLFTGGVDYRQGKMENKNEWQTKSKITIAKGKQLRFSLFLQDEIDTGKFSINISGRSDWYKTSDGSFTNSADPSENEKYPSISDSLFNLKIGLVYRLTDSTVLRGSVGQACDIPYLYALFGTHECPPGKMRIGNPEIKPETMISYEAGIESRFSNRVKIGLMGFYNNVTDWMDILFEKEQSGVKYYKWQNIDEVKISGIEFTIGFNLSSFISASANYTYMNTILRKISADKLSGPYKPEDYEGNELPGQPKNNISLSLIYNNPKICTFKLTGHYESERYDNLENTDKLDSYIGWNASVLRKLSDDFSVSVSVEDIFNEKWAESWNTYTPGRRVDVKLVVNF